jgi:uncharacterized glyoxalase superfamily protein PhnB
MRFAKTLIFLSVAVVAAKSIATEERAVKRLTPILVVEEIEPSIELWVDRLGFEKTMEVPEGGKLGFAAFAKDGFEVMYQTHASIAKEVKTAGLHEYLKSSGSPSVLFVEVESLEEIRKKVEGLEILVPHRETFYGSKELWMKEPGGHIIGFAEMPK